MSLCRFIDWWFSWASHMKVDFRKSCPSCENCEILACDGTKLGVGFQHAFVDAIETPEDCETVIPTKSRRHDRCFITTTNKSQPMFFQGLRTTLRDYCKSLANRNDETTTSIDNVTCISSQQNIC